MMVDLTIKAYDDFYAQLAEENWEESKVRVPPNLKDIHKNSNGERIRFMQDDRIKPVGTEFKYETQDEYEQYANEIIYCYTHPLYTMKNYFKIIHQDRGIIPFDLYDYQVEYVKKCFAGKRLIVKWPRQSGKTTVSAAFILFYVMFNKNKNVAIVANKANTTKEILDRIKQMYYCLPMWLKPGVEEFNKSSVTFENGCKIFAATTSAASISGQAISLLYIDEFALIPKHIVEDFIDSTLPVVASSELAKIVITSTPKGKNHFFRFFMDAKQKKSNFFSYEIPWNAPPGRNEEWKEEKIRELGSIEKFNQEYGGDFLDTSDIVIDGKVLEYIERHHLKSPQATQLKYEGNWIKGLQVYDKPVEKHSYVLVADVAEGKGKDRSTVQVIDISSVPFVQVASFYSDSISTVEFPYIIYQLATYYNDAYVTIENNSVGAGVAKDLWYDLEYKNMIHLNLDNQVKLKEKRYFEIGTKTTVKSKKQGVLYLKYLIENYKLIIQGTETIDELYHFILNPTSNKYGAEIGYHDDLIMPLVLFSFIAKTMNYFKYIAAGQDPFEANQKLDLVKDTENREKISILPVKDGKPMSQKEKEIKKYKDDVSWLF